MDAPEYVASDVHIFVQNRSKIVLGHSSPAGHLGSSAVTVWRHSDNHSVRGELQHTMYGSPGTVECFADIEEISSGIATGDDHGNVCLWNVDAGELVGQLPAGGRPQAKVSVVCSATRSSEGGITCTTIACGDVEGNIILQGKVNLQMGKIP